MLFGQLTDIAGTDMVTMDGIADTDDLVHVLQTEYPALVNSKYVIAVDKKVISTNTPLSNNSMIALLPPFSGG